MSDTELVLQLTELGRRDGDRVGGKNASLGEMIRNLRESGIRVPEGFATTAAAYWRFVEANGLQERCGGRLDFWWPRRGSLRRGRDLRRADRL
ncbi:PEP/pyruvate-binding domain-containing protein [Aurantimonas sp. A2-1-M11]|uniref:PEP/pyruvate-binding domain-containing protein n=1 Tax=Aurantimonas sp. A2-1-M11 TaxID=3113712 RepID=UPI002F91E462